MVDDVLSELQQSMAETIAALERDMKKRRTGRANVAMLDGIRVDYYGTATPLNQVASVQAPDPRLLTVKPWEKSMVPVIIKALQSSPLGVNPSSDGEIIRIPIPPLTAERRRELVKEIRKAGEAAKVSLRNKRRDANEMLKAAEKEGEISEDDLRKGLKRVQDLTDSFTKKVDEIISAKEKESLED